ncbi:MAG: phosphoenolpyruvate--protein phosphotransferase [Alphaproteobacteria bacterium]|nr:phosphoenolpyruvate--protein phosphotransferase [Alphaproteobacteria bacterium]
MGVIKHSLKRKKEKNQKSQDVLGEFKKLVKQNLSTEEKLNLITKLTAQHLKTDACTFYMMRPGEVLELYATYGLDKKSVHETFLRIGEGLNGEVALRRKPLQVENVWSHSGFVYKPETKELNLNSFAAVPVIHQDILIGVLSVQKKEQYRFSEEEIDFLLIIAMILSGMLLNLLTHNEGKVASARRHKKLDAVCLISGLAIGKAYVHKRMQFDSILSSDKLAEQKKLIAAIRKVEEEISQKLLLPDITHEQAEIFKTYLMFTRDKGWAKKINNAIEAGLTAEAAIQKVLNEITERMSMMSDPYIKERLHDFQDLAGRITRHLNKKQVKSSKRLAKNTILVAKNLGPVELLDYDLNKIKAIVLEEGSQTMHMTIVAKSLGIPVVSGIKDITTSILNDDVLAVDAVNGFLYINPSDEVLDDFDARFETYKQHQAQYLPFKNQPSETKDGTYISLNINAGLAADISNTKNFSYDGIGLYRTELPFMSATSLPDLKEQISIYKTVLKEVGNKKVIFRTLDIGSDKILPYFENKKEENPAMGWRSIRITLDRRIILKTQLRALIKAGAGRELNIMFPMITTIDELKEAKNLLHTELEREKEKEGLLPSSVQIGTMIEVPSLLFQLDELTNEVDFVSIGTNDLAQFFFATDRSNPIIWDKYDSLSPAFLKALQKILTACQKKGIPCSVCGEMASRPLEAFALLALGFTHLSMNPASLGSIKAVIRTTNIQEANHFLKNHLNDSDASLRTLLKSFATDHGVLI